MVKISDLGKRKTAYIKKGKSHFDIFVDINDDRVYDQIRIYKSHTTWKENKKKGIVQTGARAKISLPKAYKGKYVKMRTKKRKKRKKSKK